MTYQVLARKWRPKSFESLVGQEHVVRALRHALNEGRLHHAYLFTGTRGVGKTTIARILAKALNCETGITAVPCGKCSSCMEIESGRFVDLLEVDAATNTRVEEMRQLLENAVYAPTRGRFKVYVIDEVHMLSTSAFNAMLKTLEEPPEHVKFVLATTDPQKIPVTVLSRCLQFNLKQMPVIAISEHLDRILRNESIEFEPDALKHIANSAQGSMRDALSLLDQAIAHGGGSVTEAGVQEMLGTVDTDYVLSILEHVFQGEIKRSLERVDEMAVRSLSFDAALEEMARILVRIQIAQLSPDSVDNSDTLFERLIGLADTVSGEQIQLAYQILIHAREDLRFAPDAHAGFTMALLRLHAFAPDQIVQISSNTRGASPAREKPTKVMQDTQAHVNVRPEVLSVGSGSETRISCLVVEDELLTPDVDLARRASLKPSVKTERLKQATPDFNWGETIPRLSLTGMARELAQHCALEEVGEGLLRLRLSPAHKHLLVPASVDRLQQAVAGLSEHALKVDVILAEPEGETPAGRNQRERQSRQDHAVQAIESDGFVQELVNTFDASIIDASIKPVI